MEQTNPNQPDRELMAIDEEVSYDTPELADLVSRAKNGDEDALEALYDTTNERVRNIVKGPYSNAQDIEDMEQQVRVKIWRHLPGFKGEARFTTWATRIALNVRASDSSRQATRSSRTANLPEELIAAQEDVRALPSVEQITMPGLEDDEYADYAKLKDALEALPQKYRDVVILRFMGDLSHADIATRLGIEEGASKVRLFRALRDLREQLLEPVPGTIDSSKVFEDITKISNNNGFLETYWLLPTRHHDVLNWFMATGDLSATAQRTGYSVEECETTLTKASQLLARGTQDYHQYLPGGESPSDEPLAALERYSRFKSYMAAATLSDEAVRLLKARLSTEIATESDVESKLHKTVRSVGRVILHGVKFQERFPIQWLNEVVDEPEFRKYITQLSEQQQQVIAMVTNGQTVQQAAEKAGMDLYDFWNIYRVAVHELATLRLGEWRALHTGHRHDKRIRQYRWRKGDRALLQNLPGVDVDHRYVFMAQRVFNLPNEDIAAEVGLPLYTLNDIGSAVEEAMLRHYESSKTKK